MAQTISHPKVIEESWAEVSAKAEIFAEHQVRLIILPIDQPKSSRQELTNQIPGLIPPKIGSGTFEEIQALMQDEVSFSEEESLVEPVLENRAVRRSLIETNLI